MLKTLHPHFVLELCGHITTRRILSFTGDTVELQCRTDHFGSIYWTDASGTTLPTTEKDVIPGYPRLSLNVSTQGQFDLLINSSQLDDAGRYTCIVYWYEDIVTELTLISKLFYNIYNDMLLREFI